MMMMVKNDLQYFGKVFFYLNINHESKKSLKKGPYLTNLMDFSVPPPPLTTKIC